AYRLVVDEETGKKRSVPNLYRADSDKLGRCEYVMLTSKQYASVMVIDVDQKGEAGGHPENLNPYVKGVIWALVQHGIGPAWQELTLQAVKHSSSGLSIQFMQTKTVHPGTWSYFELQARS